MKPIELTEEEMRRTIDCASEAQSHKDEWKELRAQTVDLVDEHFPKGECSERGAANVLHAQMWVLFERYLASQKKEMIRKLEIAKEPLPAITMSAKEAVSFNRGIDTAIALIQE